MLEPSPRLAQEFVGLTAGLLGQQNQRRLLIVRRGLTQPLPQRGIGGQLPALTQRVDLVLVGSEDRPHDAVVTERLVGEADTDLGLGPVGPGAQASTRPRASLRGSTKWCPAAMQEARAFTARCTGRSRGSSPSREQMVSAR